MYYVSFYDAVNLNRIYCFNCDNYDKFVAYMKLFIGRDVKLLKWYFDVGLLNKEEYEDILSKEANYIITAKDILGLPNNNARSLLISKIPADKFLETMSATVIAEKSLDKIKRFIPTNDYKKVNNFKREEKRYKDVYTLLKIPRTVLQESSTEEAQEDLYYVLVKCPSTGETYILGTPEKECPLKAVAGTFKYPASVPIEACVEIKRQGDVPIYEFLDEYQNKVIEDMSKNNYRQLTLKEYLKLFTVES